MDHGIQAFFLERARFRRRLSALIVAVSLVFAAPCLFVASLPRTARERVHVLIDRTPVHFGFEGPERHVERMNLDARLEGQVGGHPRAVNAIVIPDARRGGGEKPTAAPDAKRFSQVVRPLPAGEGLAVDDIMARALRRAGTTPVFRSEDLVIETLVRPEYPDEARAAGIEGRVAFMALVDTLGNVASVELVTGEADGVLEKAAEAAVRQTRFRPFSSGGVRREVYAVFRYAFRLY